MKQVNLLLFVSLVFTIACANATPISLDTVYYDNSWNKVNGPHFAYYYKIYETDASNSLPVRFRNFYITGEIQGDGYFSRLDSINDSNSILEGQFVTYFRNGTPQRTSNWKNGVLHGDDIEYNQDGLLLRKQSYTEGLLNGLSTEFQDDMCIQQEFREGKNINDYYTISNPNGLFSKIRISDSFPLFESPDTTELQSQYIDDILWKYYAKDGLIVEVSMARINDYGKYYRVFTRITNNSFFPIEIDPADFTAAIKDKKGYDKALDIQIAEQYDKRIKRTQSWEHALTAISSGLAASTAGYSVSTTETYGNMNYGTKIGYFSGHSTTKTYNAAEAIQTQLAMSQALSNFTANNAKKREARNEGYLKHTTIKSGECIEGYFNILRKEGQRLFVFLNIADAVFQFNFSPKK